MSIPGAGQRTPAPPPVRVARVEHVNCTAGAKKKPDYYDRVIWLNGHAVNIIWIFSLTTLLNVMDEQFRTEGNKSETRRVLFERI